MARTGLKRFLALLTVVAVSVSIAIPVSAQGATQPTSKGTSAAERMEPRLRDLGPIPGEYIVKFKPSVSEPEMNVAGQLLGVENSRKLHRDVALFRMKDKSLSAMTRLLQDPRIESVEPNRKIQLVGTPDDPKYLASLDNPDGQWGLDRIGAPTAWDSLAAPNATPVKLFVIDTGVNSSHPDLAGRVNTALGMDVIAGVSTEDQNGHGTHVAGIAAALTNNAQGIAGTAGPANVSIVPIKVLDATGTGTVADVAEGIFWATDNGADVINLSLANAGYSPAIREALTWAANHGVVVTVAAGNEAEDTQSFNPANTPGGLVVAALDNVNQFAPASFSNYGYEVELIAPGRRIMSTVLGDSYQSYSGTSMAAPFVAGAAAFVKAMHPDYTRAQIQATLFATAEDLTTGAGMAVGRDAKSGYGVLRMDHFSQSVNFDDWAVMLESPRAGGHLRGTAAIALDVDGARVAAVRVYEGDALRATFDNPNGENIVNGYVDTSTLQAGTRTLRFVGVDGTGNEIGSGVSASFLVEHVLPGDSGLQIKVVNPLGEGQLAWVHVYQQDTSSFLPEYNQVFAGLTDSQGNLALPPSYAVHGGKYTVYAWFDFLNNGTTESGFYARTVTSPSYVLFDGPNTTPVDITATGKDANGTVVPMDLGEIYAILRDEHGVAIGSPLDGWDNDPLGYAAYLNAEGKARMWVEPGQYNFVATDYFYTNYLLQAGVTIPSTPATLTFNGANAAPIVLSNDAIASETFIEVDSESGLGITGYIDPVTPFYVYPGTYHPIVENYVYDTVDSADYDYLMSMPPLQVKPLTGAVVNPGVINSVTVTLDKSTHLPGTWVDADLQFTTDQGGEIWYGWNAYTGGNTSSLRASRVGGAYKVAARKEPVIYQRSVATRKFEAVKIAAAPTHNARPWATVKKGGTEIALGNASWTWADWLIPADAALGNDYTLEVALDAGITGAAQASKPFAVAAAGLTTGIKATVLDRLGAPLPDADVTVFKKVFFGPFPSWIDVDWGSTDTSGQVSFTFERGNALFDFTAGGDYLIVATRPEATDFIVYSEIHGGGTIMLDPAAADMSAVTVQAAGIPNARARVTLLVPVDQAGASTLETYNITLDANGQATVYVKNGSLIGLEAVSDEDPLNYYLLSAMPTEVTGDLVITLDKNDVVDLALNPRITTTHADGTVTDRKADRWSIALQSPWASSFAEFVSTTGSEVVKVSKNQPVSGYAFSLAHELTSGWVYVYRLNGLDTADDVTVTVDTTFTGQMSPLQSQSYSNGSSWYFGEVNIADSRGNQLIGMQVADWPNGEPWFTVTKQLREKLLNRQTREAIAALKAGVPVTLDSVKAQDYVQDVLPQLSVLDPHQKEVVHNNDELNFQIVNFTLPAGSAPGEYTAKMTLGVNPENTIEFSTSFAKHGVEVDQPDWAPHMGPLTITYDVPAPAQVTVAITNPSGSTVYKTLVNNQGREAGRYTVSWDGKDTRGRLVPSGNYLVQVTERPTAGETLAFEAGFQVYAALSAPTLKQPSPALINTPFVDVTGTGPVGAAMTFTVNGESASMTPEPVNNDGTFTARVPLEGPDGAYKVTAVAVSEIAGSSRPSNVITVTKDTTAPVVRVTSPVVEEGLAVRNNKTVSLRGVTEGRSTLALSVSNSGGEFRTLQLNSSSSGAFSASLSSMPEDTYMVSIQATDSAGNVGEPMLFALIVDYTAPDIQAALIDLTADEPMPLQKGTNTVNGTHEFALFGVVQDANTTGTITVAGTTIAINPATGEWMLPLELTANRANTFRMVTVDIAGNKGQLQAVVFPDTKVPTVSLSSPRNESLATGPVKFSGMANEALSALRVYVSKDGQPEEEVTADVTLSRSKYSFTLEFVDDGRYLVRVEGDDLVGNVSSAETTSTNSRVVLVDSTAPTLSVDGTFTGVTLTADRNQTFTGTVQDDVSGVARVTAGRTSLTRFSGTESQTWSIKTTLNEGLNQVAIWATDKAGNKATLESIPFILKTSIRTLTASVSGTAVTVTTDAPVTYQEAAHGVDAVTIEVYQGTTLVGTVKAAQDTSTRWIGDISSLSLAAGKYTVKVTAQATEFGLIKTVSKAITIK